MAAPILQLIAPSGYPNNRDAIARGVDYFHQQGWQVAGQASALRRYQRFAGTDEERLLELNRLARYADANLVRPDLIMALRGGYGLSRILDGIDFPAIAKAQLRLMGHSDFTAFTLAMYAKTGQGGYCGPMLVFDFGAEQHSDFTLAHFWRMMNTGEDSVDVSMPQPYEGEFEGVLWGGNLTMVTQLIGSPYLPAVKNGVLFLEDINEHPYRIERHLYQLRDAGILAQQQAVLLGQFNGYSLYDNDGGYDFKQMVEHMRSRCDTPLITALPFGHVRDKLTLPVGGWARVEVKGDRGYSLHLKEQAKV